MAEFENLGFLKLEGWSMHEKDFRPNIEAYLEKLDHAQKSSFAPIDKLCKAAFEGMDLHVMALRSQTETLGLVVFN